RLRPRGVLDRGQVGHLRLLRRPERAALRDVDGLGLVARTVARIEGAAGDPLFEVIDHFGRQLAAGGHLEILVRVLEGLEQEALARFAGDESGAGVAALEDALL